MKDDEWVDVVEKCYIKSARQRFQMINYMELDDDTLERVRVESKKESERRQKER